MTTRSGVKIYGDIYISDAAPWAMVAWSKSAKIRALIWEFTLHVEGQSRPEIDGERVDLETA